MTPSDPAIVRTAAYLERAAELHAHYRAGRIHAHVPEALADGSRSLEDLVGEHMPASHAALQAAARGLFFSLPWFFGQGYDVLLYTLPFHGARASRTSPYSGAGLFAGGLAHLNEAMAHAVHDFRSMVDYLRHTGVERVALTGLSLGGYTSALLAAVEARLEAVIPNCPVVTPAKLFDDWLVAM